MAFELEITSRNIDVNERIKEYIGKKVKKLDRHFDDIDEIKVDLVFVKSVRSSTDKHIAQITARGKGFMLRAEENAEDIFAAFDIAIEKMQRQVDRFKGKRNRGRGSGISLSELSSSLVAEKQVESLIVRHKKFELLPMDEIEALEQMKLLSHEDFFIFFNIDNNAINVLYKRNDGTFGVIEPVVPK